MLRRAGLVHDLGRVGISSRIWGKPEPLSVEDWERVRLHPYLSERILRRAPPLAGLAGLVGSHHERLDGSGYYRGVAAPGWAGWNVFWPSLTGTCRCGRRGPIGLATIRRRPCAGFGRRRRAGSWTALSCMP